MEFPKPIQHIAQTTPYKKSAPIADIGKRAGMSMDDVVYLASNENPTPPSRAVLKAILDSQKLNRYPDTGLLYNAIAQHNDVSTDQVVLGNGSNDILDLIARAFLYDGTEAISSQYGFAIYRLLTQLTGAKNVVTPARNFGHDLMAMSKAVNAQTKVIWIANPNNPTGTFLSWKQIKHFLDSVPSTVVVVLDQAYYEYLDDANTMDAQEWIQQYPNLIITRTFSKAYGLAGLRVGYGLSNPTTIELLNRVRQPFNVNSVAITGATAALYDQAFIRQVATDNRAGRAQLKAALQKMKLSFVPSFANFLLVEFSDTERANQYLQHAGVLVRPVTEYGLPNHLRITIGTTKENQKLLNTLQMFLNID